jgi:1-phosphofructokinase family hexose kinase
VTPARARAGPGRLLVAGPNLTIDRTLALDELVPGSVLRFTSAEITPGGKGVNVARAASRLGCHPTLVALVPGHTGMAVARLIEDEGVRLRAVPVAGEVRSTAIVLESDGRVTVFNEPGPRLDPAGWARYVEELEAELPAHTTLLCSGSAPPGAPPDAYARLVSRAATRSMLTVVDADGPLLERALEARPEIVAPNLVEAEALLWRTRGREVEERGPDAKERALRAARALVERKARVAIVTAGAAGLAAAWDSEARWIQGRAVEVVNPVGAGDTFVAGLVCALESGQSLGAAIAEGMGTAAAGVETRLAGDFDPARARALSEDMNTGDWGPELGRRAAS